jgi:putative membrane protein
LKYFYNEGNCCPSSFENSQTQMKKYYTLVILFLVGLIISGIQPHDYFTWALEIFPAILGFMVLLATFNTFKFTRLSYWMVLIHCYILFIGGHYTYAEVPLFDWIKEWFHQSRNNYDKVGHFAQGFIPALIARELFIRLEIVQKRSWLPFLTICVCVFISVVYEFLEWFIAIISGESADSFLGTQGYVWDTQSDMLFATIGAISMLITLSKVQDKQIQRIVEGD